MNKSLTYSFIFIVGGLIVLNVTRLLKTTLLDDAPADYRTLFSGSQLMYNQVSVYDTSAHVDLWNQVVQDEHLHSSSAPGQIHVSALTYPPHAYPFYMFNQFLSWKQSRFIWWGLCVIFFGLALYALKHAWLIALGLGFKGSYFALLLGQPMILVFASMVAMLALIQSRRHVMAGILIPLALIKFTLVVPLIIWLAFQKKWKTLIVGFGLTMIIYVALILLFPSILGDYFNSASRYYQFIYSASPLNLYPQLNSELTSFIHNIVPMPLWLIKLINLSGQLIGYSWLGFLFYKKRIDRGWLLYLLFLVSFLFSYHLIYDALVFLIPMGLIYQSSRRRPWVYILPFILVSLPWNRFSSLMPLVQFHFPLILVLALGLAIHEMSVRPVASCAQEQN